MRLPAAILASDIGYAFSDPSLLLRALTHRSAAGAHNERLEFLGDAVLGYLIAEALYRAFPAAQEGELTRARANLVRRETLAAVAREVGLGRYLQLGGGELKSGGRDRDSILANAFEALVGAIFLDGGIETCRRVVLGIFAGRLSALAVTAADKDSKTRLQELLQSRQLALPRYTIYQVEGAAHSRRFTVECRVEVLDIAALGNGTSRRQAEQEAASKVLEALSPAGA